MPRYHFTIDDRGISDRYGAELADIYEARVEAAKMVGSILGMHGDEFWDQKNLVVHVRDEQRCVLFAITVQYQEGG